MLISFFSESTVFLASIPILGSKILGTILTPSGIFRVQNEPKRIIPKKVKISCSFNIFLINSGIDISIGLDDKHMKCYLFKSNLLCKQEVAGASQLVMNQQHF